MSQTKAKQWWLYILELEQDKLYVGITSQTPEKRMQEHVNGIRYAYWTQKYKPVWLAYAEDLGAITKEVAEERENKLVRELMKKHGYNNVRGGDLRDTEDYSIVFGYVFDRLDWQAVLTIILLLLIITYFGVILYLK